MICFNIHKAYDIYIHMFILYTHISYVSYWVLFPLYPMNWLNIIQKHPRNMSKKNQQQKLKSQQIKRNKETPT